MAVYLAKMKRKDIEDVDDDGFYAARKIRRLDAELPPIIEEEEPEFPMWIKPSVDKFGVDDNLSSNMDLAESSSQVMGEMPVNYENVERAVVLFNPITTPLPVSPSRFSIDSDILFGIKKDILRSNHYSLVKSAENEEEKGRKDTTNDCLAVVPWNPSFYHRIPCTSEIEEDEQMGEAIMDFEEDSTATEPAGMFCEYNQLMNENLCQWQQQQQHCMMIPQYSQMNANWGNYISNKNTIF